MVGAGAEALAVEAVAPKPGPAAAAGPRAAHLLAVGDCGVRPKDLARQRAVSDGMARYAKARGFRPNGLAMLGDNFYGGLGAKGVGSPRWEQNVEAMYPPGAFPCPVYAVLGNHDYNDQPDGASAAAQLAYSRHVPNSRWTLPHKWYAFDLGGEGGPLARVVVIDTNFVFGGGLPSRERKRQFAWLADELAGARRRAPFLFVLGHHPVFSDGSHGDTRSLVDHLDPLLRRHRVDLYLSGHDHDLQHIEMKGHPTSFAVSGAGGARAREIKERKRGRFAKAVYGFTHLDVREEQFVLRHVDANGRTLHAFEKARNGRVEIL